VRKYTPRVVPSVKSASANRSRGRAPSPAPAAAAAVGVAAWLPPARASPSPRCAATDGDDTLVRAAADVDRALCARIQCRSC
jgi:hypothetical protein